MIRGLHHSAYRCRDSEETRKFYEDFLGLSLAVVIELESSKTGRATSPLHSFYALGDGSFLAFFETPDEPFAFKEQHDFDLHLALEVEHTHLQEMLDKGKQAGIESRGIAHHGFVESVYFRDPNGYVIELTARLPNHNEAVDPARNGAREKLAKWQANKATRVSLCGASSHKNDLRSSAKLT